MGGGGGTNMVCTDRGLFVLRNGVLAKYDLATLKAPEVFELFGPAPAMPTDATDRTAVQAYQTEMQRRLAPGLLLTHDNSLLVIVGNGFARINQDTLAVEATADLTPPAAATAAPGTGRAPEAAPAAQVQGDNLYLARTSEVLALNLKTGAIVGRAAVPEDMLPRSFGGGMGGNRGGGAGGGRGGRGGGGGAAGG